MVTESVESDMGIGVAALFAAFAAVGAVAMVAAPGQLAKAWAFGGAMVAAMLAVVALHAYD